MMPRDPVGPIQVMPPGLLNMLQLKSGGTNPDAMRQDVQPVFDLEAWWMRATRLKVAAAYGIAIGAPNAIQGFVAFLDGTGLITLGPTAREWWYVHSATAKAVTTLTATSARMRLGTIEVGGPLTGFDSLVVSDDVLSIGAAESGVLGARGFWMPPSSSLALYVDSVASAGGVLSVSVSGFDYSVLPI